MSNKEKDLFLKYYFNEKGNTYYYPYKAAIKSGYFRSNLRIYKIFWVFSFLKRIIKRYCTKLKPAHHYNIFKSVFRGFLHYHSSCWLCGRYIYRLAKKCWGETDGGELSYISVPEKHEMVMSDNYCWNCWDKKLN